MRQRHKQPQPRRLRKQPKMRRVQSAHNVAMPRVSVPKTARKRRRRNKRRFHLPTAAVKKIVFSTRWISLGLLAITIYALVLVGLDEQFYLTIIPVEGAVSIPAQEIVQVSGLGSIHVFAADPNQAALRIAELPGVISAAVTINWPNRVSIQVEEDSPVAIWREGVEDYWITKNGNLIPSRTPAVGLLTVESELPPVLTGEQMDEPQPGLAFIPEDVLAGAMLLRELRPNIETLYYRPATGLSYQDGRGWRVYFGTGTDMQQKLVVYETMVAELLARELTPTYISVSNQEKPYYLAQ